MLLVKIGNNYVICLYQHPARYEFFAVDGFFFVTNPCPATVKISTSSPKNERWEYNVRVMEIKTAL